MAKKKLTVDELVDKAKREGLACLTNAQLELLNGRSDKVDVKIQDILNTRLKISKINKGRTVGRPSRRAAAPTNDDWLKAQEQRIMGLTAEEAEAELSALMAPAQNDLIMITRLNRIVDEGGKAGSDAARIIEDIRKRYIAPVKRVAYVTIQTTG